MSQASEQPAGWKVSLALTAAIVSISFAAIFFKKAQPTHPLIMSLVRLAIASALLSPLVIRARLSGRLSNRHLLWAMLGGLLYAVHFGSWVWSLTLTSVAASVTLVTATPLLLAMIGLFTGKDRPTRRIWLSLGVASAGIFCIGWNDLTAGGGSSALVGDALALLGALAMAFYFLMVRQFGKDLDVWGFLGAVCFFATSILLVVSLVAGVPLDVASTESLLYLGLSALIPQLIGHTSLTWSLRHVTPTTAGIATLGEPVGASLLGILWLGEWFSGLAALGCALTLIAVGIAITNRRKRSVESTGAGP
ncbi:MAG: DMT family transporter [Myxococcota bacterium]|jgi:drug/metabolite transporter (DMT)-like permease|nr:DMT family transporter [Myxococcota bacterium]